MPILLFYRWRGSPEHKAFKEEVAFKFSCPEVYLPLLICYIHTWVLEDGFLSNAKRFESTRSSTGTLMRLSRNPSIYWEL
jgi:hypothetical protein